MEGLKHGATAPHLVRVRPRRLRQLAVAAAVLTFGVFFVSAVTLSGATAGGGQLLRHDGLALAGVGALLGLVALTPLRIRATADAHRIRVFNLVGDVDLPWSAVRAIRYRRGVRGPRWSC